MRGWEVWMARRQDPELGGRQPSYSDSVSQTKRRKISQEKITGVFWPEDAVKTYKKEVFEHQWTEMPSMEGDNTMEQGAVLDYNPSEKLPQECRILRDTFDSFTDHTKTLGESSDISNAHLKDVAKDAFKKMGAVTAKFRAAAANKGRAQLKGKDKAKSKGSKWGKIILKANPSTASMASSVDSFDFLGGAAAESSDDAPLRKKNQKARKAKDATLPGGKPPESPSQPKPKGRAKANISFGGSGSSGTKVLNFRDKAKKLRFEARIQTQLTLWRNLKTQFGSDTSTDLKAKEVAKVMKELEDILVKDDPWELFQNFQGTVEQEGLALRASVSLASQQLSLIHEVVECLADREDGDFASATMEECLIRCKAFASAAALPNSDHGLEERTIAVSPALVQELRNTKCKDASEMKDWWGLRLLLAGSQAEASICAPHTEFSTTNQLTEADKDLDAHERAEGWLTAYTRMFRAKDYPEDTLALLDVCLTDEDNVKASDCFSLDDMHGDLVAIRTLMRWKMSQLGSGTPTEYDVAQTARQKCLGSSKIMRQFSNLAQGVDVLKEFDDYALVRRKIWIFSEKIANTTRACKATRLLLNFNRCDKMFDTTPDKKTIK